jgi:hypothetical protein
MKERDQTVLEESEIRAMREFMDRQSILDCITNCARGIDRLDRTLVLSAYHPDGIDDHGIFVGTAAEFFDWLSSMFDAETSTQFHYITNHRCEIHGDEAHAETYYVNVTTTVDVNTIILAGGRYIDRFERRSGQWKIALRYCLIEWTTNAASTAHPFANLPEAYTNGVPSRGKVDPSYRRPLNNLRS